MAGNWTEEQLAAYYARLKAPPGEQAEAKEVPPAETAEELPAGESKPPTT